MRIAVGFDDKRMNGLRREKQFPRSSAGTGFVCR